VRPLPALYDLIEPVCARLAARVLDEVPPQPAPQAAYLVSTATRVAASTWGKDALGRDPAGDEPAIGPTLSYLQVVEKHVDEFLTGSMTGDDVFGQLGGQLWVEFQDRDPIGSWYADQVALALRPHLPGARLLELGGGVGATTRRIGADLGLVRELTFTDVSKSFLRRIKRVVPSDAPVSTELLDVNEPPSEFGTFDVIYGTNVVHVARDPVAVLRWAREHLSDGGIVVLGEGAPYSVDEPWPLELLFALLPAWWDVPALPWRPRAGFLTTEQWVWAMKEAGLRPSTLVWDDDRRCFGGVYYGL
jgi:SAM-dependent methyltransferase